MLAARAAQKAGVLDPGDQRCGNKRQEGKHVLQQDRSRNRPDDDDRGGRLPQPTLDE